jgi:hypothetical protein
MRAFKVFLNGKKLCLAGIGNDGVLNVSITHAPYGRRRDTFVYVGGLISPRDEHVRWKQRNLRVGDEIRLKIVESVSVDEPGERFPRNLKEETKREKRYVLKMAKKLGWKIQGRAN